MHQVLPLIYPPFVCNNVQICVAYVSPPSPKPDSDSEEIVVAHFIAKTTSRLQKAARNGSSVGKSSVSHLIHFTAVSISYTQH